MARSGVTFGDVVEAASSIKAAGDEPTIDRVRQALGTGSKSTLAPLLKRWKAEQGSKNEGLGLSTDLMTAVRNLHQLAQQSADEQIETARQRFLEQERVRQQQIAETEETLQTLQKSHETLTQAHSELQAANQQLTEAVQQSRASAAARAAELEEVRSRLEETRATVVELKQQLSQARSQAEHYQQAVAEERRLEREHLQHLKIEWSMSREEWTQRMTAEVVSRKRVEDDLRKMSDLNLALERHKTTLQVELDLSQQKNERQGIELIACKQELGTLKTECAAHTVVEAELRTACKHLEIAVRQSNAQVDKLETRLKRADEQSDRLSNENHQLRQTRDELHEKLRQSKDAVKASN